jgi:hypothetical protein
MTMANYKTGFKFYPVDTDRYQDIRIKRLRKDFGCNGLAVYDYILCEIYRDRGGFLVWGESTAFDVSDYFGLKESLVKEIVKYCGSVGLFDKALLSRGIITSEAIQRRYLDMCLKAKRMNYSLPQGIAKLPELSAKLPEESLKLPEVSDKVYKEKKTTTNVVVKEKATPPEVSNKIQEVSIKEEIAFLKTETIWLNNLTILHNADVSTLMAKLDDFYIHCVAEGKESHDSIKDAKSHFNSWLRIQKQQESNNKNGNKTNNARRRGTEITATSAEDYKTSF